MSRNNHILCLTLFSFFLFFFPTLLPALPDTDPVQTFLPNSNPNPTQTRTPPATTIPAFPEQSDETSCPLDLPDDLFTNIKHACTGKHGSARLRRSRCCPVLAAWLYSAYSATALNKSIKQPQQQTAAYYDLPLLPNDSETCVDSLENGLKSKGIELMRLNESCDVVSCECGIRLHPLSCTTAFSVNSMGGLIGNYKVEKLERDCLNNVAVNGFAGLNGCSKCLKTLHLLNKDDNVKTSKSEERSNRMHNEDCELMGLTWLLAKNRSAYIHTVSAVLRATMMNTGDSSSPESCTLNSDGMPLAVDSSEINGSSSSSMIHSPPSISLLSLCMLYLCVSLSIRQLLNTV